MESSSNDSRALRYPQSKKILIPENAAKSQLSLPLSFIWHDGTSSHRRKEKAIRVSGAQTILRKGRKERGHLCPGVTEAFVFVSFGGQGRTTGRCMQQHPVLFFLRWASCPFLGEVLGVGLMVNVSMDGIKFPSWILRNNF
jgi:hypothetical protein